MVFNVPEDGSLSALDLRLIIKHGMSTGAIIWEVEGRGSGSKG